MNSAAFFAVGTIGLSKRCGRKPSTLTQAARHNRREIQAELGANGRIDASRMNQNESIVGPASAAEVVKLAQSLMAGAGINATKLRKDHVQAIELLFSLPSDTAIDDGRYFRHCVAWAGDHFGKINILSADIHRDESAPHCHVLVLPLVDGRMRGSDLIDRNGLRILRESFYCDAAKPFGLKKPVSRMAGSARADGIKAVLQALQTGQDGILHSAVYQVVKLAIERDPAPFMNALGIEAQTPSRKPLRTMAQIFTSPGKGAKTERKEKPIAFDDVDQKPIGFQKDAQKDRKLCTVAFDNSAPTISPQTEPAPAHQSRLERGRAAMNAGATRHLSKAPERAHDDSNYSRVSADEFDLSAWQNDSDQFSQLHH